MGLFRFREKHVSNAEEDEVEHFYEDLQDLLELIPIKDVLFIIGDWNAKVGSQETPGVTAKFGLGIRNEAGQRLIPPPDRPAGEARRRGTEPSGPGGGRGAGPGL